MKRGRPKHYVTGKHIYCVHIGNKIRYIEAESPEVALKIALGGRIVGQLAVGEYLSKEKAYQEYFKDKFVKGGEETETT